MPETRSGIRGSSIDTERSAVRQGEGAHVAVSATARGVTQKLPGLPSWMPGRRRGRYGRPDRTREIRLAASLFAVVAVTIGATACTPAAQPAETPASAAVAATDSTAEMSTGSTTPEPLRLDSADRAWVEHTLAGLTLRQRAAQVIMPWISGASARGDRAEFARMLRWAEHDQVGGLIVSTGRPADLAAKLSAAQSAARIPLLVASDLESGPAMRLRPGGTEIPPAMALGAANDETLARAAGAITGREARAVGIHVTLGPVLDVNSNPDNPIINIRSFGEDPDRVARLASAWIEGARAAGLQAIGKHFPGHGDTRVDSHVGRATIPGDSLRLATTELVPFRRAVAAGLDGMLVGHIAVPAIEGPSAGPASLSPVMIRGLLRERMNFDGLVVTDALNMGAITGTYSVEEASIRALLAGADILLQPPGTASVISAVVRAVESGRLPRERLDEAVRRVLLAKARAGLNQGTTVDLDSVRPTVGRPEHHAVARRIAGASITLVRDRAGLVPISTEAKRVLHVSYAASGRGTAGSILSNELAAAGYPVEHVRVRESASRADLAALRRRADSADLVLASVLVAPHQYRALSLSGGFAALVEELAATGKPVIGISLGSPYVLEAFPSVPTYLLSWSASAESQRAAAVALLGQAPIDGRLPVSLPPHHPAGEGLERARSAR